MKELNHHATQHRPVQTTLRGSVGLLAVIVGAAIVVSYPSATVLGVTLLALGFTVGMAIRRLSVVGIRHELAALKRVGGRASIER